VCKKIRENILPTHIPFIFFTSNGSETGDEYWVEVGGDNFIVKPFSTPILKEEFELI